MTITFGAPSGGVDRSGHHEVRTRERAADAAARSPRTGSGHRWTAGMEHSDREVDVGRGDCHTLAHPFRRRPVVAIDRGSAGLRDPSRIGQAGPDRPAAAGQGPAVHTGQHYDPALVRGDRRDRGDGRAGHDPRRGGPAAGSPDRRGAGGVGRSHRGRRPAAVVVQGDTNSALAGGLAANARSVPVVHVEAGLRSHDRRMPEEHNRILLDHLADLCLAPTEVSPHNLLAEGIPGRADRGDRQHGRGSRRDPSPAAAGPRPPAGRPGSGVRSVRPGHAPPTGERGRSRGLSLDPRTARCAGPTRRPADPPSLPRPSRVGSDCPRRPTDSGSSIPWTTPTSWASPRKRRCLISDSGGVQEEVSVLKRPVVVVRRSTERPEVLGSFADLVDPGPAIGDAARKWLPADRSTLARMPHRTGTAGRRRERGCDRRPDRWTV